MALVFPECKYYDRPMEKPKHVVSVRISDRDQEVIAAGAAAAKESVSDTIRKGAVERAKKMLTKHRSA